jgi:hypothetical protein
VTITAPIDPRIPAEIAVEFWNRQLEMFK